MSGVEGKRGASVEGRVKMQNSDSKELRHLTFAVLFPSTLVPRPFFCGPSFLVTFFSSFQSTLLKSRLSRPTI